MNLMNKLTVYRYQRICLKLENIMPSISKVDPRAPYILDAYNNTIVSKENLVSITLTYALWLEISSSKVVMPPGAFLSGLISFIYSKRTKERVFDEVFSNMHAEYFESLDRGFEWKARWIHVRGIINILIAASSQLSVSMLKTFIDIWKIG